MSEWKLDPGVVAEVLTSIDEALVPLNRVHASFDELVSRAAQLETDRVLVAERARTFFLDRQNALDGLLWAFRAKVEDVGQATEALIVGAEEMASNLDRAAAESGGPVFPHGAPAVVGDPAAGGSGVSGAATPPWLRPEYAAPGSDGDTRSDGSGSSGE